MSGYSTPYSNEDKPYDTVLAKKTYGDAKPTLATRKATKLELDKIDTSKTSVFQPT